MNTRITTVLTALTAGLLLGQVDAQAQPQRGGQKFRHQPPVATPATAAAEEALLLALAGPDGEYAAYAEYAAIIARHGEVQPYVSLLRAEECHIGALRRQFERLGLAVPENPYLGKMEVPASLGEAAQAAVRAEESNAALYDQLLEKVKDQPALVRVFTHLQSASKECHLPVLKAAVENEGKLDAGAFACGNGGCGQRRGGPPAWAGGQGRGMGQGWRGGACQEAGGPGAAAGNRPGCGMRCGAANQDQDR
jgi:hypothetical protein